MNKIRKRFQKNLTKLFRKQKGENKKGELTFYQIIVQYVQI